MEPPTDWAQRSYDVIVIGGGINGAAIARDAALRGLHVLLLEKEDWGWGTIAKSSRLAHGGLRYLELMEFGLVHEALQDRERLLRDAPHIVRPLRFLYPIYPDIVARRTVRVGLLLYDVLSHGKSVPNRDYLSRDEALAEVPALNPDGLRGAAVYYDAQIHHVERLVIANVRSAHAAGAVVVNHACVEEILHEGGVEGVRVVHEGRRQQIKGRTIVNAAGTWVDEVLGSLADGRAPKIRKTKGIHVAVPRFLDTAMIVRATDGRTFFVIPWQGTCYIGTTDTDFEGDAGTATATAEEVAYLLDSAARYVPDAPLDKVLYTWAGVRALVNEEGLTESNVTRRHILYDHARDGVPGIWSLQGGKITTARSLAEACVDALVRHLDAPRDARRRATRDALLPGAPAGDWDAFSKAAVRDAIATGLEPEVAGHLVHTYGTEWADVAALGRTRLGPAGPHIVGEVDWAVAREQARTLSDFMMRRTTLALSHDGAQEAAVAAARRMATLLDWNRRTRAAQLVAYRRDLAALAVPSPSPAPAPRRPEAPLDVME